MTFSADHYGGPIDYSADQYHYGGQLTSADQNGGQVTCLTNGYHLGSETYSNNIGSNEASMLYQVPVSCFQSNITSNSMVSHSPNNIHVSNMDFIYMADNNDNR